MEEKKCATDEIRLRTVAAKPAGDLRGEETLATDAGGADERHQQHQAAVNQDLARVTGTMPWSTDVGIRRGRVQAGERLHQRQQGTSATDGRYGVRNADNLSMKAQM